MKTIITLKVAVLFLVVKICIARPNQLLGSEVKWIIILSIFS